MALRHRPTGRPLGRRLISIGEIIQATACELKVIQKSNDGKKQLRCRIIFLPIWRFWLIHKAKASILEG
jgi:hypothetical protein